MGKTNDFIPQKCPETKALLSIKSEIESKISRKIFIPESFVRLIKKKIEGKN